ncbi:hypothetical protein DPMN_165819 [Dreissena polymorpha]|uniref:Uncharacterized protein n=1 Tax=Dreissena polymorpha TaxID=45954 RepID=A0A9D4EWV2_DREPO|nr:hypothetical protein DPMN_165819 [Dreissena polymorpha]
MEVVSNAVNTIASKVDQDSQMVFVMDAKSVLGAATAKKPYFALQYHCKVSNA